jgi:DNA-binding transcriptional regulator YdaS (Cro superfamily)
MDIRTYLCTQERGAATQLADALGVSLSFLSQMASGTAAISPARCVAIEQATGGAVTRRDLRPDDWRLIWPELAQKAAA